MNPTLKLLIVLPFIQPLYLFGQKSIHFFADSVQKGEHGRMFCAKRKEQFVYVGGQSFDSLGFSYTPSLVKLDTTGNTIWSYSLNKQIDPVENSIGGAVYGNGYLRDLVIDDSSVYADYYGNSGHELWKIDEITGDLVWKRGVPGLVELRVVDSNRIAYTYNGPGGYTYELVDKSTGKSSFSVVIAPSVASILDCHFSIDPDGSVYIVKTDSILKYSSPTLNSISWAIKAGSPGYISAVQPETDGLYFFGAGPTIFAGKLNKTDGSINWIAPGTSYQNVLEDHISDFKIYGNYVYISGGHDYSGSIYTAYHICKIDRTTGALIWETVYNPYWNPYPTTNVGYVGINSFDLDVNGNLYTSGYEQGGEGNTGVWGVCKFNSNGALIYHDSVFDGNPFNSVYSRGMFSFVFNNRVFHVGELQRISAVRDPGYNGGYSNVYFFASDTGGKFNPYIKKRTFCGFQEFSDLKEIKKFSSGKFAVYKQLGNAVSVELRDAQNGNLLWTKTLLRDQHLEADKMNLTADNKIVLSALGHASYQMQFDYGSIPQNIYFITLDSTGSLLQEKKYFIGNQGNFKPIQLYSGRDTNTVYVYSKLDYYNNPLSIHFFNINRATGALGDFSNEIGSIFSPLEAKQTLLIPLSKDIGFHLRHGWPFNNSSAEYDLFSFKNNSGGGYLFAGYFYCDQNIVAHNLAYCDSSSIIYLGKDGLGNFETVRYNPTTFNVYWVNKDAAPYSIIMASCSKKHVYLTGTKSANLVIRQVNIGKGGQNWEKIIAPPSANQYYVPLNQIFNPQRNQYTIVGYIADSSSILTTQSAFYITVDTTGNLIKQFTQKGDYNQQNSLKSIEVSQFGQTLIGGALYKYPYGRSGVLIEADSVLSQTLPPTSPVITANPSDSVCEGDSVTLTANSPGCTGCTYSWSVSPVINNSLLVVKTTGIYQVTAVNNAGSATASQAIVFSPIPPKPSITRNGNLLKSSVDFGNQWYLNGQVISGADFPQLLADTSGLYNVQSTLNGCMGPMSDGLAYVKTNGDSTLAGSVILYPNPVTNQLHISNKQMRELDISLYSPLGKKLFEIQTNQNNISIDMQSFGPSIYYVIIQDKKTGQKMIAKIVKI
jgi:Secretion system C-terminal sorting domain